MFQRWLNVDVFAGILQQVWQYLLRKTPLTFDIFSIILSICYCHLLAYYLTKPLWNCVSVSQICCSKCCSLSFSLSVHMTQYVENFKLQIPHHHICWHSLNIHFVLWRPLKIYFRATWNSPYKSKPNQISIKK